MRLGRFNYLMTNTTTPRTFTDAEAALIGKRWEGRNGVVRYYINDWPTLLGFEIERSRVGNLRGCRIPGVDSISNAKAEKLMTGKVWIEDGDLYSLIDWTAAGIDRIPVRPAIEAAIDGAK